LKDFTALTDLANRRLGSGVVAANDDFFAEKENLLNSGRADFTSHTFGHKGQIYDGWETRRRREAGNDWAIIRLGASGIVKGVIIDTGNFTGNYPERASIEATSFPHVPTLEELSQAHWITILEKSSLKGDFENAFEITDPHRWTHIRLSIYPDGGVARLRVHGIPIADPTWIKARGTIDLAAIENGGDIIGSSDDFYSSSRNTLQSGNPLTQGDGWENKRRRGGGNDWFAVKLAISGSVSAIEIDTTHFKGNAPGQVMVSADNADALLKGTGKITLLSKITVQPDTQHKFISASQEIVSAIRLDVFPDGGLGRFRVWGTPDAKLLAELTKKFNDSLFKK